MTNVGSLASIAHLSFDKIRFSTFPLSYWASVLLWTQNRFVSATTLN